MKLSNLETRLKSRTPKQLLNHLKKNGWITKEIVDFIIENYEYGH